MLSRLYAWLDSRLKLEPVKETLLDEPIPGGASWIYVFGSATLFVFFLQAITGMFLAVYYAPTPDHAYDSIRYIETQVLFGPFVRGLHHWGASAMVVAIGLHMLQVFLYGAYKPPRELMWMVGVLLLLLTMGFAFTGYLLPWDQNAYWATQVGINMVGSVPFVGTFLVRVMRGGDTLGALTLSRFFAVHVLFLPATIMALVAMHLFILRRVGAAGPWSGGCERRCKPGDASVRQGRLADLAATDSAEKHPPIERRVHSSEPFYPRQVFMDAVVMFRVCAVLALPLRGRQAMKRTGPAVAAGRALFERLQCTSCHRIHGEGGAIGPDLSYVGDHRDRDWLIKHFRDPRSTSPGSIMPKFPLNERELNDLTAYMLSLKRRI